MAPGDTLIIGPGRLGQNLALALAALGRGVRLHGRRPPPALPGVRTSHGALAGAPIEGCDLVLLTVSDGAIEAAANALVNARGWERVEAVMHTSGLKSGEGLGVLRGLGVAVGSVHPLQSFSLPPRAGRFDGVFFAVEGDGPAKVRGAALAEALGGWSRVMSAEAKIPYHAAAVVASNLLISLVDAACEVAGQAGLERGEALEMLLPLIEGSVANLRAVGLPDALTGPISRGDADVVEAHVETLAKSPELLNIYTGLSRRAITLAAARGGVSPEALEALSARLTAKD